MAHLVGAQDQEQGERKRDALIEQFGGFQGIDPLLQGPGDDGGDHRGQEQPQVQQAARRLGRPARAARTRPPAKAPGSSPAAAVSPPGSLQVHPGLQGRHLPPGDLPEGSPVQSLQLEGAEGDAL